MVIQEVLNASECGPNVAQRKGGCRDVVTAAGGCACREPATAALKHAKAAIKDA
jgi:hypothetical protein